MSENHSDNRGKLAPSGLTCELLSAPEKSVIQNPHPCFGWIFNISGKGDYQKAYQLLVSDSKEAINKHNGNMLDTGKTCSPQSVNIKYSGKQLSPDKQYFWKVRTWSRKDEVSEYSAVQSFKTGNLASSPVTPCNPLEEKKIAPVKFTQKVKKLYFMDFGKAAFGTIEVTLPEPARKQTALTVYLGEKLAGPSELDRAPEGCVRFRKIEVHPESGQRMIRVKIPPDQRNTGPQAIRMPQNIGEVLPFRYCEIETTLDLNENSVKMIAVFYPFDDNAADFNSSDQLLNDVWDLCKYSIKATSFCGIYVDGDRERIPYEADAYLNQLAHYCVDREYNMARRTHEYLIRKPTWPTEWILHSVLMAWADYLYTGNALSISKYYDDLKAKTLCPLARRDGLISTKTGLVNSEILASVYLKDKINDIVDWPPASFRQTAIASGTITGWGRSIPS